MRKTVKLKKLVDFVNKFNSESSDDLKEHREAYNMLLERLLMDADVYQGFSYLLESDLSGDAMSVGIRIDEDGVGSYEDTDETRLYYYKHDSL